MELCEKCNLFCHECIKSKGHDMCTDEEHKKEQEASRAKELSKAESLALSLSVSDGGMGGSADVVEPNVAQLSANTCVQQMTWLIDIVSECVEYQRAEQTKKPQIRKKIEKLMHSFRTFQMSVRS